ncbi:50S ribosomal protein L11 methyltransferase [Hyphobacterium sp. HN65]|uniref:Ribosomal protein L11 methyltransferase n=1 Tax=Hyphobacterium lacteum TaxID=3116575 RepID=A0ABU7LRN7_9PROT|nr:50S ribosomal protein L11 methyltransferase [Hyphobacterium sp. HN65]MEE2526306.1 50S ribosomal protein L11 methyltransferase [Hyphobacterium sp. HN65]
MILWKLVFSGPMTPLYDAAERLGNSGDDALSVSVFENDEDETEGWLEALYAEQPDEAEVRRISGLGADYSATCEPLPEEDWVTLSQKGLPPVIAGRFALHGSHDAAPEGKIALLIEAGPAFGTGHHGTTRGCLIAFDKLLDAGFTPESVLDVGTGTGALAIAARKALPDADVLASDIDPDAVEESVRNAVKNEADGIDFFTADGFEHIKLTARTFDLVFANILARPLIELAPRISMAMHEGSVAILSGLMEHQEDQVAAAYLALGLVVERQDPLDGWSTLVVRKV